MQKLSLALHKEEINDIKDDVLIQAIGKKKNNGPVFLNIVFNSGWCSVLAPVLRLL